MTGDNGGALLHDGSSGYETPGFGARLVYDRPLAYVASPYSGATAADVAANVERARAYSLAVYNAGYTPLTPHLLFPQFLTDDDPAQRAAGIALNFSPQKARRKTAPESCVEASQDSKRRVRVLHAVPNGELSATFVPGRRRWR